MSESIAAVSADGDLPGRALRLLAGAVAAVVVTFLLYWLMAELIASGQDALTDAADSRIVDFVRLKKKPELEIERQKPEKPDKPEPQPRQISVTKTQTEAPTQSTASIAPMQVEHGIAVSAGFGLSASDGEYLPIVKVAPIYPPRAQSRGTEGWVLLEFTVTETGAVRDPVVIEAEPSGIFDQAAIKAVLKFKYKPRVEDGKPIAVPKVQHLITFKIER